MLVFLCSAFLTTSLISTFSLTFMLNSFSLLTTVETQLQLNNYTTIWDHELPSQNEGALIYQNSSSTFSVFSVAQNVPRSRTIFLVFVLFCFFNFSLSLSFRTGIKSCLRVWTLSYLVKTLLRIQHGVFHSVRWILECLVYVTYSLVR